MKPPSNGLMKTQYIYNPYIAEACAKDIEYTIGNLKNRQLGKHRVGEGETKYSRQQYLNYKRLSTYNVLSELSLYKPWRVG